MADSAIVAGFLLFVTGIALVAGLGWACVVAGVLLFAAGGVASRHD